MAGPVPQQSMSRAMILRHAVSVCFGRFEPLVVLNIKISTQVRTARFRGASHADDHHRYQKKSCMLRHKRSNGGTQTEKLSSHSHRDPLKSFSTKSQEK